MTLERQPGAGAVTEGLHLIFQLETQRLHLVFETSKPNLSDTAPPTKSPPIPVPAMSG